MEKFKIISLIIASTIFVILLIMSIITIVNDKKQFPPVISKCPDYFTALEKNGMLFCGNEKKLGTCNPFDNIDMNTYKGSHGDCLKKQYSDKCGLSWDGITNNKNLCNN